MEHLTGNEVRVVLRDVKYVCVVDTLVKLKVNHHLNVATMCLSVQRSKVHFLIIAKQRGVFVF